MSDDTTPSDADRPTRRDVLTTAGLATTAATTATAGCLGSLGGGGDVQPVNGDELTLWHAMGGGLGETLTELGDQFQSETGITINMEFQDSYETVLTNFLGALDSGEVPDFAQIDSLFAQQVLRTGKVEPVEAFLSEGFPTDDYLPNVTDFFTVDGALQSLPFNNSNAILYYNRTAFEEAGLDPDSPPATVDAVYEASKALVDAGVVDAGITWPNHVWFVEHWYSTAGQTMFDAENGHDGDPTTLRTDNAAATGLYEWWRKMNDEDLFINPGIEAWGEATSAFLNQDAAMLLTSTAFVAGARSGAEENGFEVDNAFYPTVTEDRVGPVIGGASFFVPDGMPDGRREDIGAFLEFMSAPETQKQWHKGTGYYPIRQTAVDDLEGEGWFDENPMFRTAMDQLTEGESAPATRRMLVGPARQCQQIVQDGSVEIFNGDVDVETGLQRMKSDVESQLE